MPTGKGKHCRASYVNYHQALQESTQGLEHICAHKDVHCLYSTHAVVCESPKLCALHRSLLVSLWEWFVGKVGELTLRWANNNRISKNTFCGSHSLCVWLITPGMSSADWRLNNLHRVTWWQLETHNAIRTVRKDDKAMVRPSVVFLTGKDTVLLLLWRDESPRSFPGDPDPPLLN